MDSTTAILMLLAGLLHAGWHAIVKNGNGLPTLAGMGTVSAAVTLPFLFFVELPSLAQLPILALSLLLHAAYKVSLALAYERNDLSQAYPLARGVVPLFAALLSFAALRQVPNGGQFTGIVIVSAGLLAIALERSRADSRLLLAALGAGSMVACYSVLDAFGTRTAPGWAAFTAWLIVLDSLVFLLIARAIRGRTLWPEINAARGQIVIAGLLGVTSFAIFVWALSRNPVAIVVAFRECSVLFATLIGVFILKETVTALRLGAAASIAVGLALIAAWR